MPLQYIPLPQTGQRCSITETELLAGSSETSNTSHWVRFL